MNDRPSSWNFDHGRQRRPQADVGHSLVSVQYSRRGIGTNCFPFWIAHCDGHATVPCMSVVPQSCQKGAITTLTLITQAPRDKLIQRLKMRRVIRSALVCADYSGAQT
jgi:hypothetical protein